MANNLYKQLNMNKNLISNDFGNVIRRFNDFRRTFNGDPKTIVQQMLNNGTMSQGQFNQLRAMAEQFQELMKNVGA